MLQKLIFVLELIPTDIENFSEIGIIHNFRETICDLCV